MDGEFENFVSLQVILFPLIFKKRIVQICFSGYIGGFLRLTKKPRKWPKFYCLAMMEPITICICHFVNGRLITAKFWSLGTWKSNCRMPWIPRCLVTSPWRLYLLSMDAKIVSKWLRLVLNKKSNSQRKSFIYFSFVELRRRRIGSSLGFMRQIKLSWTWLYHSQFLRFGASLSSIWASYFDEMWLERCHQHRKSLALSEFRSGKSQTI